MAVLQIGGGASGRNHSYSAVGTYCIKAQSRDTQSATSGWSACLNVDIQIQKHTIDASAGLNGSISPSGPVTVDNGANQSFSINPDQNYRIADVVVDGTSVGRPSTYTFNNVDRNHTIVASFAGGNVPPVADAGVNQTVRVTDTVQLNGSGSSDVDGDSFSYTWSFTAKPAGSKASLSNPQAIGPSFVADVAGNYVVQLIVNDGTENSRADTVTISAENSAPVANTGADQTVPVFVTVQLDGSGSSDVDGDALTFSWSFTSVPEGSLHVAVSSLVDNQDDGFSSTGNWKESSASDENEGSSYYSNEQGATATWTPDLPATGTYNVYAWWSYWSDRDTNALYTVNHAGGSDTIRVDQRQDTGRWVLLGTYRFDDGTSGSVTVTRDSQSTGGSTSADAVMFEESTKLTDTTAVNPSFVVDAAGTYIVQLIVNDGTVSSPPDFVSITTENSAPVSNAGEDQTVEEGELVTLNGSYSSDPDDNIAGYEWRQTGGKPVVISDAGGAEATFTAPSVTAGPEMLMFQLTVLDEDGLEDVDTCQIEVSRAVEIDSDGDDVPDSGDAFPHDPSESLDTDGDGYGNNADSDDDNDGMPDAWEVAYGLDPLRDDAADDLDGDDISNINEYNLGSKPDHYEGNIQPDTPAVVSPENGATVSLVPLLEAGEFNDPNINDFHGQTQWKITRAFDDACVFDITTATALTSIEVPKQILEEETEYIWQVRFIDSHNLASEWSEEREFTTDSALHDADKNGVPDDQEIIDNVDLDGDGTMDSAQPGIKCISLADDASQICVSIRDAENASSILSLEAEDPNDPALVAQTAGKPNYIEFGLLDFKLLVNNPGDKTTVTIYLSRPAYTEGNCFKYDPVNAVWLDYSDYTRFSSDRKKVNLTLEDGGFGDADGIKNGIIVDPLAFGSATDPSGGGGTDSVVESIVDSLLPDNLACFIAASGDFITDQEMSAWPLRRKTGLALVIVLLGSVLAGLGLFVRKQKSKGSKV